MEVWIADAKPRDAVGRVALVGKEDEEAEKWGLSERFGWGGCTSDGDVGG